MTLRRKQAPISSAAMLTVIGPRIMATLTFVVVVGCANGPTFRASWYLEEAKSTSPSGSGVATASEAVTSGPGSSAEVFASAASAAESLTPTVAPPVLYLALLNEGREKVHLTQIVVNPDDSTSATWVTRILRSSAPSIGHMTIVPPDDKLADSNAVITEMLKTDTDQLLGDDPDTGGGRFWKPGELLVFKVIDAEPSKPQSHSCSVPVAVQIHCGNGCSKTQPVSGALPNYLHRSWLDHCQPLRRRRP